MSETLFNFENLFVFEMANNHQGDVKHGLKIIKEMGKIAKEYNLKAAIKLQFRQYDTFIHPNLINDINNKHVKRFLSTRLSKNQFQQFITETKNQGMITMVTPFDEESVDVIDEMDVDIIKIGSPSLYDFPLLERVCESRKPIIFSSGGCSMDHIDNLVSLFSHRHINFAIMHCVSIYPTPNNKLELNSIQILKNRYPNITIGFSTHECPENTNVIRVAYALGARMFEKHVAIPTEEYKVNLYSGNPEQVEEWVKSYCETIDMMGNKSIRNITDKEKKLLKKYKENK